MDTAGREQFSNVDRRKEAGTADQPVQFADSDSRPTAADGSQTVVEGLQPHTRGKSINPSTL
jgi:hypothetical protein